MLFISVFLVKVVDRNIDGFRSRVQGVEHGK